MGGKLGPVNGRSSKIVASATGFEEELDNALSCDHVCVSVKCSKRAQFFSFFNRLGY